MKQLILLFLFLSSCYVLSAQSNDCQGAIVVCDDPSPSGNPSGNGENDFADPDNDPGCLQTENNTIWLYFEVDENAPSGLTLGFILDPLGGAGEDYDWALYGPNVPCGDLGSPIRCSSSSGMCAFCPQTGMGMGTTDFSEGPGTGDGFVSTLNVDPGQGFFLVIDNFNNSGSGFNLDFTGDAAEYLDCNAEPPCAMEVNASANVIKCQGDPPFSINANVNSGIPPLSFFWEGDGNATDYLDNNSVNSPQVTLPEDFFGTIQYIITVTSPICEVMDTMFITVNPKPDVILDPIPLTCNNTGIVTAVGTPINGTWGGVAGPLGKIDPSKLSPGIYPVTLSFTNSFGCMDEEMVTIEIAAPEKITIEPIESLCKGGPPYLVNVDPTGGVWTGDIEQTGIIDPSNYSPGAYAGTYTYTTPEGCISKEDVLFNIIATPLVEIIDPLTGCTDQIQLQLQANPLNVDWGGQADAQGFLYPSSSGKGNFQVIAIFTTIEGCVGADTAIIVINEPPSATITNDVTVCNSTLQGLPVTMNFTGLITSGDNGGSWIDLDNSGASGTFPVLDFTGINPGNYKFEYTTNSATPPCLELKQVISVNVLNCNCPFAVITSLPDLCTTSAVQDLLPFLNSTQAGSWTVTNGPGGTNPTILNSTIFNGTGATPGVYTINFTLNNTPPAGCTSVFTNTITLVSPPIATIISDVTVCNNAAAGSYPASLDFFALISSGNTTGFWADINSSGASGPFTNLSFNTLAPGTYLFEYNLIGNTPCPDVKYATNVHVVDCNCPDPSFAAIPDLCSQNLNFDLNPLIVSGNTGVWNIIASPGTGTPATISNNKLVGNNASPGSYTIQFTVNGNVPQGCPASTSQTLDIIAPESVQLTNTVSVCNNSGNPGSLLNLSGLIISGNPSGTWKDVNNSGATGTFPNLNFTGVASGSYSFSYTVNSVGNPCPDQVFTANIVVKDCNCPDVTIIPALDICNSTASLDLNTLKLTTESGTWQLENLPAGTQPMTIMGNTLNSLNADPGIYTLRFILGATPPAGCPASAVCLVEVFKSPKIGTVNATAAFCAGDLTLYGLETSIQGEDLGGAWSYAGTDPKVAALFSASNGTIDVSGLSTGTYGFNYLLTASAPCVDADLDFTIIINALPLVDLGADQNIDCNIQNALLKNLSASTGISNWQGPGITIPNQLSQNISQAGTYILQITASATGCSASDTIVVNQLGDLITEFLVDAVPASCPGSDDGQLVIDQITGGIEPYSFELNGVFVTEPFDNLMPGNYTLLVTDASGCSSEKTLIVTEGKGFTVDLGPDKTVLDDTPVVLTAALNIPSSQIISYQWSPNLCPNCGQVFNSLIDATTRFYVFVTDVNGCTAKDSVLVKLRQNRNIYIPDAFSPNADGTNDNFFISAGKGVKSIRKMAIYDRWGGEIFVAADIQPNDPGQGWNGLVRGKPTDPGVFVYWAEIEFDDGFVQTYKGDITVIFARAGK